MEDGYDVRTLEPRPVKHPAKTDLDFGAQMRIDTRSIPRAWSILNQTNRRGDVTRRIAELLARPRRS